MMPTTSTAARVTVKGLGCARASQWEEEKEAIARIRLLREGVFGCLEEAGGLHMLRCAKLLMSPSGLAWKEMRREQRGEGV